ncbi:MAG: glycosyl-4,4'-diaponeurosporenoate acyltransferase CrtO family protein, partial [Limisphaerales bacterium]
MRSKSFAFACKLLRIELFRTLLRRTFWNARLSRRLFYNRLIFDGTRRGLAQYDNNTRRAEFIHTVAFITILPVSLYIGISADP